MGSCESKELAEQTKYSRHLDKSIKKDSEVFVQKLLLLGPGESGKSTCLKQMHLLHHKTFSEAERKERLSAVLINAVSYMQLVMKAAEENNVAFGGPLASSRDVIMEFDCRIKELFKISPEIHHAIKVLWAEQSVRKIYELRATFHLPDSASYFFDNIDRLAAKDYIPTAQDILHSRVPTTGVVKETFSAKSISFEVYDVGGQRSERRKWLHCFDNVNAMIYIVAISEYDQALREDNKTNRLVEALDLYDSVANSRFFVKSSVILFLNKKDLFAEKVGHVSLKICFPSYSGGNTYSDGVEYIKKQFKKLTRNDRKVYMHETCATDTSQVQVVIASVIDTIIQENLRDTGML